MRKFCLCKTREGGGVHRMLPSSCNTRFLKRISRSVRLLPTNRDTWIYNVAQRSEGAKCTSGEQRWHQRHTTASHQGGGLHRGDQMRTPGVEPGSQAWEACMIPLHYVRCYSLIFNGGNLKCRIAKGADLQYCMDQIHGCQLSFRVRLREHNNCGAKRRHST